MRAVVLNSPGEVAVSDIASPSSDGGLALVRIEQAGICGTDLAIASGAVPVRTPRVLGHEMTGVFEDSRVLVNPGTFCGSCDLCRRDRPNLCRNGGLLGRDSDGCFAEFVAVPGHLLHPVPSSMSLDEAALLQVLATCVHAQSQVQAGPLTSAVVVGLGVTGLLHVQLLRARGVSAIIGVTRSRWKRSLASRFGATAVASPSDASGVVGDRGADLVIESAGTSVTLALAMELAAAGGTVLVFGVAPSAELSTYQWYYKELSIVNTRAQLPRDCDAAIQLATTGTVDLAPLVTARYPLDRAEQALRASAAPTQLKVVLDIPG
jgi:L-iditol 2-dehydrogenase